MDKQYLNSTPHPVTLQDGSDLIGIRLHHYSAYMVCVCFLADAVVKRDN